MTQHKIHIAVLDTDVPCPLVYAKRGLYSSQFRVLLQAAAERLNKNPQDLKNGPLEVHTTAFDVVGGSFPSFESLRVDTQDPEPRPRGFPGPVDVVLVTGAAAAAYDDLHWIPGLQSFIQIVHHNYPLVKIFGSCFGHQLIAQALLVDDECSTNQTSSGKVSVEPSQNGHEIGIHPITLNPAFSSRFAPLSRFSRQEPFRIQLIHGDVVVSYSEPSVASTEINASLPDPWINVGSTSKCLIQGLYSPGRVLTLQGHFEFDAFATAELCKKFGRNFDWSSSVLNTHLDRIWSSSRRANDDDDDSKAAAEAVLLFFAGEDCA